MRTARAKRTQKTQIFRILPHRAPVRHFQKTTTRPIPAAIVLGTAVVATALPLPSSTPATATGTAHVTRAYTDKSTHEPGKEATITAETSTGGNVHFSVSPDDGGRPTPLDFTTGTDEQGRTTLTFNVGRLASWDMVVFSPATYADRVAAAPQAVDTSDNAAATDADVAGLVPATIVGQLRNGLGQCLTSRDPKGSNGTPVANSNCAGKEIVAHSISMCPNLAQQQEMLQILMDAKPEGAKPIVHSDMGWQYQHETYISTLAENGFIQSMSRKGNCIDNGATEQVFGHLKDEFFRGQDWQTFESFKADLDAYITHWNTTRRHVKLKGLTPAEYRNQALQEAA